MDSPLSFCAHAEPVCRLGSVASIRNTIGKPIKFLLCVIVQIYVLLDIIASDACY